MLKSGENIGEMYHMSTHPNLTSIKEEIIGSKLDSQILKNQITSQNIY